MIDRDQEKLIADLQAIALKQKQRITTLCNELEQAMNLLADTKQLNKGNIILVRALIKTCRNEPV